MKTAVLLIIGSAVILVSAPSMGGEIGMRYSAANLEWVDRVRPPIEKKDYRPGYRDRCSAQAGDVVEILKESEEFGFLARYRTSRATGGSPCDDGDLVLITRAALGKLRPAGLPEIELSDSDRRLDAFIGESWPEPWFTRAWRKIFR